MGKLVNLSSLNVFICKMGQYTSLAGFEDEMKSGEHSVDGASLSLATCVDQVAEWKEQRTYFLNSSSAPEIALSGLVGG